MEHKTDVLILGCGSAGFGAAYRALLAGDCTVTIVEKNPGLGGTSTYGGVNCWEPGVGGEGVHYELAKHLMETGAGFVGETFGRVTSETPWGRSSCSKDPYEETLERAFRGAEMRRFHFEPRAMDEAMQALLRRADKERNGILLLETEVTDVETENGRITAVTVENEGGALRILPKIVIDCTGDIVAARMAGCAVSLGEDAREDYGEPNAPEYPQQLLNGMTQLFRVTPCEKGFVDEIPEEYRDVDVTEFLQGLNERLYPVSCFNDYPDGDINVNMLPTLNGAAILDTPEAELRHICNARAWAYWNWLQTTGRMDGWRMKEFFPMLGVRETWHLKGRYVLREQDMSRGFAETLGRERTIAWSDHPADLHGSSNKTGGMTMFHKYGIPYECLLPVEIENLLVACRGSSFSHIAGSSARLSRTMIALGEAAGEAAAQCVRNGILPAKADVSQIRAAMGIE